MKLLVMPLKNDSMFGMDWEEYKKKSEIERFFGWIKSCKKAFPRLTLKNHIWGYTLAAIVKLHEVLGQTLLHK